MIHAACCRHLSVRARAFIEVAERISLRRTGCSGLPRGFGA
jgi:hypothetical protein